MKKLIALLAVAGAVTAQAQTVKDCEYNYFIYILYAQNLSTTQCLDAKDCQDYLDAIKKNCTENMILSQGQSVKKAIANIQRKKDNFISATKEQQRLASLPGVQIGMTAEQVIKSTSWGRPHSVNRTTTAQGVREQWSYGYPNYLYFTNGVLTSFQN